MSVRELDVTEVVNLVALKMCGNALIKATHLPSLSFFSRANRRMPDFSSCCALFHGFYYLSRRLI
jgi:hypothetical protein